MKKLLFKMMIILVVFLASGPVVSAGGYEHAHEYKRERQAKYNYSLRAQHKAAAEANKARGKYAAEVQEGVRKRKRKNVKYRPATSDYSLGYRDGGAAAQRDWQYHGKAWANRKIGSTSYERGFNNGYERGWHR
ncbi:MAG: hypothetical protein LBN08_06980 [Lactobacillales bacterium]|jgi:hypothetical protein|nr:hypothetical protein [Lactobacillales bacterium]